MTFDDLQEWIEDLAESNAKRSLYCDDEDMPYYHGFDAACEEILRAIRESEEEDEA